mmetsp:Transcript_12997/g.31825  ORF Transcript_12997/g.31825 Transcript_12997/m.31825 type:complete len:389 (+) Transcript_12997:419-1585(+)
MCATRSVCVGRGRSGSVTRMTGSSTTSLRVHSAFSPALRSASSLARPSPPRCTVFQYAGSCPNRPPGFFTVVTRGTEPSGPPAGRSGSGALSSFSAHGSASCSLRNWEGACGWRANVPGSWGAGHLKGAPCGYHPRASDSPAGMVPGSGSRSRLARAAMVSASVRLPARMRSSSSRAAALYGFHVAHSDLISSVRVAASSEMCCRLCACQSVAMRRARASSRMARYASLCQSSGSSGGRLRTCCWLRLDALDLRDLADLRERAERAERLEEMDDRTSSSRTSPICPPSSSSVSNSSTSTPNTSALVSSPPNFLSTRCTMCGEGYRLASAATRAHDALRSPPSRLMPAMHSARTLPVAYDPLSARILVSGARSLTMCRSTPKLAHSRAA